MRMKQKITIQEENSMRTGSKTVENGEAAFARERLPDTLAAAGVGFGVSVRKKKENDTDQIPFPGLHPQSITQGEE